MSDLRERLAAKVADLRERATLGDVLRHGYSAKATRKIADELEALLAEPEPEAKVTEEIMLWCPARPADHPAFPLGVRWCPACNRESGVMTEGIVIHPEPAEAVGGG